MAVWAYACTPCRGQATDVVWYVAAADCERLPPEARIVRVKVKHAWRCAAIDRSRRVDVEGLLVRPFTATEARSCDECEDLE